ncbi:MAG: glycosyltransferase [Clostridia bacterium]|nr:glycosyltransferase [Clostridia bacterium]
MKKIGIVGHFGGTEAFFDGQTVKTKNSYRALCDNFGEDNISVLDTYYFRKAPINFLLQSIRIFFSCKNIVILPDANGIRVFIPMYSLFKFITNKNIQYNVIGGWLPEFFKKHRLVKLFAKRFDAIYVETSSMKEALEEQGFSKIFILPNFKYLPALKNEELVLYKEKPFKLCIFSRIMAEKGIEDAINIVSEINSESKETVFTLDLFGPIDEGYETRFNELNASFPEFINYKGIVPSEKSVEVVKDYFALLFPTRFYTEGVPGTLIDAMAAGVPVISSLWVNYKDVFIEGITGWGYEFENINQFKQLLLKAAEEPDEFLRMKETALEQAKKYEPSVAISELIQRID